MMMTTIKLSKWIRKRHIGLHRALQSTDSEATRLIIFESAYFTVNNEATDIIFIKTSFHNRLSMMSPTLLAIESY